MDECPEGMQKKHAFYWAKRSYKETRYNPKYIKVKKRKKLGKSFNEIITRSFDIEYYSKHKNESIMDQLYK